MTEFRFIDYETLLNKLVLLIIDLFRNKTLLFELGFKYKDKIFMLKLADNHSFCKRTSSVIFASIDHQNVI